MTLELNHKNHPLELELRKKTGNLPLLRCIIGEITGVRAMTSTLLALPENGGFKDLHKVLEDLRNLSSTHTNPETVDNIPTEGPLVVAANHPYIFFDSVALGKIVEQARPNSEIRFISDPRTDLIPEIAHLTIPVGTGRYVQDFRNKVNTLLQNNGTLIIFPSGHTTYKSLLSKKEVDAPAKSGAANIAKANNAPILPAYIDTHTGFFYNAMKNILPANFTINYNLSQGRRKNAHLDITLGELITDAGDISPSQLQEEIYKLGDMNYRLIK